MRFPLTMPLLLTGVGLSAASWRSGEVVNIGVYVRDKPYAYIDDEGNITGFGPELARMVCRHAGVECTLVPFQYLEERIPALDNGTVDALFASLAVTREREQLLDYLKPYYDAYDISLVALGSSAAALQAGGVWDAVRGKPVCAEAGDAAIPVVRCKFGAVIMETASREELVDKLVSGECLAATDGSYGRELFEVAAKRHNATLALVPDSQAVQPGAAAAAVAKGQAGSELALRLTGGLVAAMSRGDGSDVLRLDQQYLVANGIPPRRALGRLVDALTTLY